nr:serine protease SPPA, chloroplastic [Tanacetum cinerariifolium]
MLKTRLCIAEKKKLPLVNYKKYSKVKKGTLGLSGGKDKIAVIRASGGINRVEGPFFSPSSGIIAEKFIEKIRRVRELKRYKAVIIRIDSPGGDGLASDLMWREISLLAESKPVIASMVDMAASGGYYMAMAAHAIVSENLTLTGSIGVVRAKFNWGKLYEKIGYNEEIISKGQFSELNASHRSFRPEEKKLYAESTQAMYKVFRDNAASSRSMSVCDHSIIYILKYAVIESNHTAAISDGNKDNCELKSEMDCIGGLKGDDNAEYPSGESEFKKRGAWKKIMVKLRTLIACQRVSKGSVLNMKLRGKITDQVKGRFSSGLSLPQICENLTKAAYDPRICGVYLHIETLKCGWAKVEEIRRHILDFRKSGRFIFVIIEF